MFTASGDNTIKAFESKSGTCKRSFVGHTGAINCILVSLIKSKQIKRIYTKYFNGIEPEIIASKQHFHSAM